MRFLREFFSRLGRFFSQLTPLQRAPVVILAVSGLIFLVAVIVIASRPPRAELARDLTPEKIEQITRALREMNEPFEVRQGAVIVPASRRDALRQKLAKRSILIEQSPFGFDELAVAADTSPEQRALVARQTELARMIQTLDGIAGAQVILKADPNEAFQEANAASGATVRISTRSRQALRPATVDAVVDMVTAAVPRATWRDVVVVTTHPPRSYRRTDPDDFNAGGNTKFALKRQIEDRFSGRIQSYFARLGITAVASVSVKLNLDRTHEEFEILGDPAEKGPLILKEKRVKRTGERKGVILDTARPGALPAQGGLEPQAATSDERENEFAYDKQIRVITKSPGELDEIRASVVLFDRLTEERGKRSYKNIAGSIPEFRKHVANMIGTTEASIEMMHMPHGSAAPPPLPAPPTAYDRIQAAVYEARAILILGVVALIAMVMMSRMVRSQGRAAEPRMEAALPAAAHAAARPEQVDEGLEHLSGEEKVRELRTRIKRIIDRDPRRVGNVLRRWLHRI